MRQALDYGAALWDDFSDREEFFAAVDRRRQATAASPLLDALREAHGGDEGAAAATRENIWQNIAKGEFRFILPMDRVDDSLKALVRFVNENSRFTIYPVELEQYQHDGFTVVVPRIFGAEARKQVGSRGTRGRPSSAEEFLEDVHRRESAGELTGADVAALRTMITLVTEQDAEHNWYVGAPGRVSVSPRFPTTGAVNRAPFTLRSDGNLCLNAESARGIAAWRDWLAQVAKLVGRGHDTRQFLELKPGEWVSKCEQIVALTKPVLAAHLEVAE